jgi:hypothetical protein
MRWPYRLPEMQLSDVLPETHIGSPSILLSRVPILLNAFIE